MTDIVEHVAKVIGINFQLHDFGHVDEEGNFRCTVGQIDLLEAQSKLAAQAAIRATIEYIKTNVSKQMIEVGNDKIDECIDFWNYDSGAGYSVEQHAARDTFGAMLSQALSDLPTPINPKAVEA